MVQVKRAEIHHKQLFQRIQFLENMALAPKGAAGAMLELCSLYLAVGRPDKVLPVAQNCFRYENGNLQALKFLFDAQFAMGQIGDAKRSVQKALKIIPDKTPLYLDLAACLEVSGQNAKAGEIYNRLLKQVAKNSPHRALVVARGATFLDGDEGTRLREEVDTLLGGTLRRSPVRPLLHQAAAKIAENEHRLDKAFSHYAEAGKATARNLPPEMLSAEVVERVEREFTALRFERMATAGNPSARPIFVFGMQRSGTTLCEQILSSHPSVYGAGELPYFDIVSRWHRLDQPDTALMKKTAADYLQLLESFSQDALRVVDKRPENFQNLWLIAALFPNAQFIHCRRDPLDTCVSCFKRPIKKAYRRDLASIGQYYRNYLRLMEHWSRVLPVNIFELNYEELVSQPEQQIRKIVAHVDLEWDDACLSPHQTKRAVNTPSRNQVSRPIDTSSVGSWRQYRDFLDPLISELGELVRID